MNNPNRFLIGFGIFVLVFAVVAVIVAVAGSRESVKLLSENTSEGTVQRFLMAIKEKDYVKAYNFLSPQTEQMKGTSIDDWMRTTQYSGDDSSWKASIVRTMVKDDNATVEVAVDVFRPGGLFGNPVHTNRITFLLKKEGSSWKINQPVDLWWLH